MAAKDHCIHKEIRQNYIQVGFELNEYLLTYTE